MKLIGRNNQEQSAPATGTEQSAASKPVEASGSVGKGRPTPKRNQSQRTRGPVMKAPLTRKEARERRKALRGPKLSKDERKIASAERRLASAERREKMMAGDDKFLLPRDRGPVRGYVRDIIDSRRNFVGLFMPAAFILLGTFFVGQEIQTYVTIGMLVIVVLMVGEGVYLNRLVNNRVIARFPDSTDTGPKLGWYAFVRASQLRRMRAPRPRVKAGDPV